MVKTGNFVFHVCYHNQKCVLKHSSLRMLITTGASRCLPRVQSPYSAVCTCVLDAACLSLTSVLSQILLVCNGPRPLPLTSGYRLLLSLSHKRFFRLFFAVSYWHCSLTSPRWSNPSQWPRHCPLCCVPTAVTAAFALPSVPLLCRVAEVRAWPARMTHPPCPAALSAS